VIRIVRERERKKLNAISKNTCNWRVSRTVGDSDNSDTRKKKRFPLKAPTVPTNQILTHISIKENIGCRFFSYIFVKFFLLRR
jgi:hypothetical protein